MATLTTLLSRKHSVILSVLLLAVMASGFSQIELHTHSVAQADHVHDVRDHAGTDDANSDSIDDPADNGVVHTHDIGAPALAVLSTFDVHVVAHQKTGGKTAPPTAHPPDHLIEPLHRPPIV